MIIIQIINSKLWWWHFCFFFIFEPWDMGCIYKRVCVYLLLGSNTARISFQYTVISSDKSRPFFRVSFCSAIFFFNSLLLPQGITLHACTLLTSSRELSQLKFEYQERKNIALNCAIQDDHHRVSSMWMWIGMWWMERIPYRQTTKWSLISLMLLCCSLFMCSLSPLQYAQITHGTSMLYFFPHPRR